MRWGPLFIAAVAGKIDEVERILDQHAYALRCMNYTQRGDPSSCQCTIEPMQFPPTTPLYRIIALGRFDVARLLIARGADINMKDHRLHRTPLHLAAKEAQDITICQFLLENKADVSARDEPDGHTPLHTAIMSGHHPLVRLLLAHGADTNAENSYKWTPLFVAIYHNCFDIAKTLLDHGADATIMDDDGDTAFHLAIRKRNHEFIHYMLQRCPTIDLDMIDGYDETALHIASHHGDDDIVRLLLAHGADVSGLRRRTVSHRGTTPLHLAVKQNHTRVIRLLLSNRADVEPADETGVSPLLLALARNSFSTAMLLLQHTEADPRPNCDERATSAIDMSLSLSLYRLPLACTPAMTSSEQQPHHEEEPHHAPGHTTSSVSTVSNDCHKLGNERIQHTRTAWSLLHWAAWYGDAEIVAFLLNHAVDTHCSIKRQDGREIVPRDK